MLNATEDHGKEIRKRGQYHDPVLSELDRLCEKAERGREEPRNYEAQSESDAAGYAVDARDRRKGSASTTNS